MKYNENDNVFYSSIPDGDGKDCLLNCIQTAEHRFSSLCLGGILAKPKINSQEKLFYDKPQFDILNKVLYEQFYV